MNFEIKLPPLHENEPRFIRVMSTSAGIVIRTDDGLGGQAVISLREPQRSEFIRKIKELKTNG